MMATIQSQWLAEQDDLVRRGIGDTPAFADAGKQNLWQHMMALGTESWLDTGDMQAADALWDKAFKALTTNNSLLNTVIQSGCYDRLIAEAADRAPDADVHDQVRAIGLLLNVHHALRLVQRYQAKVSVELHTDLAHDIDGTIATARQIYSIAPRHFIIKVPFTPSGLIAIRRLREDNVPINCTLGFSARQNYIATCFARPNFVNVFLGRINSFVANNDLGRDGIVGVKTTLASQRAVQQASMLRPGSATKQIAASMRSWEDVAGLAGVDVHTMPTSVAEQAISYLDPMSLTDHSLEDPQPDLNERAIDMHIEKLWVVSDNVQGFTTDAMANPPEHGAELQAMAERHNLGDMLPAWHDHDRQRFRSDGKLPDYGFWREHFEQRRVGLDAALNAAGLQAFASDQQQLDEHIRQLIAK